MKVRLGFGQSLLFLLLSVGPVTVVQAGTLWTSPITSNVVWTKAGSPHTWGGVGFQVGAGGVVTIEPGAVVKYPSGQDLAVSADGRILAVGTADEPITIGGVSETALGGALNLYSSSASEFRFCHFANMWRIYVPANSPQGNPLFEHCVFRKFSGSTIYLEDAPARVLHCIFYDNAPNVQAVDIYCSGSGMTDEKAPTVWYNSFDRNGMQIFDPTSGGIDLRNHEFFRFNRVASGKGVQVSGQSGILRNLRLVDCDFGSCNPSININSATYTDMTISRCSISNMTGSSLSFSGATNLQNNYWGTTNVFVAQTNALNGMFSTNTLVPLAATNLFPQADVDGSDEGNLTRPADADLVKKYIVGMTNLTAGQLSIADVDHNGKVDARDALIIESYVNGLIWKLPVP
jgi:hypothetical protein